MAYQTSKKDREGRMTPTKIFKKTAAAYEIAKIAAILFWLPVIAMFIVYLFVE
jgi:hypothetical protein